jgi:hypothetical protein
VDWLIRSRVHETRIVGSRGGAGGRVRYGFGSARLIGSRRRMSGIVSPRGRTGRRRRSCHWTGCGRGSRRRTCRRMSSRACTAGGPRRRTARLGSRGAAVRSGALVAIGGECRRPDNATHYDAQQEAFHCVLSGKIHHLLHSVLRDNQRQSVRLQRKKPNVTRDNKMKKRLTSQLH